MEHLKIQPQFSILLLTAFFAGTTIVHAQTKSQDAKFNSVEVNGVAFKNTRFDPKLAGTFYNQALQMAEDYGYTAHLKIDAVTAQLIRLRVSQKNNCAFCIILHANYARKIGINPSKVDNISSYWNSELYSDKEKAVLAYTDKLSAVDSKDFQIVHDKLANYYSLEEITDIVATILNMELWTRFKLAQGQTPYVK